MAKRRSPPISEFEEILEAAGMVFLFRKGASEHFFSQGYPMFYEKLEEHRGALERLGMYEACSNALHTAENLFKRGPEFDEEGQRVLLEANRALMKVSGSYNAMARRFQAANDSPK